MERWSASVVCNITSLNLEEHCQEIANMSFTVTVSKTYFGLTYLRSSIFARDSWDNLWNPSRHAVPYKLIEITLYIVRRITTWLFLIKINGVPHVHVRRITLRSWVLCQILNYSIHVRHGTVQYGVFIKIKSGITSYNVIQYDTHYRKVCFTGAALHLTSLAEIGIQSFSNISYSIVRNFWNSQKILR